MDLQQIKYFLSLADELHFWNTSRKMNITQSALSRHIQAMEKELNVQLFERNKRNVKLTAAGEFLKVKWATLLDELEFVHAFALKIDQGEKGTIRIAHPDSISSSIIPDLISRISSEFPELHVELVQLVYENQQEYLRQYKIDLAFTRETNRIDHISARKIHTEQFCMVVSENHPFQSAEDINAETLREQQFILPASAVNSSYTEQLKNILVSYGISSPVLYDSYFGSTIIGLVKKGLGISIMPFSYAYGLHSGVRFIKLPFQTDLLINWRTEDNNPILRNVLQLIDLLT